MPLCKERAWVAGLGALVGGLGLGLSLGLGRGCAFALRLSFGGRLLALGQFVLPSAVRVLAPVRHVELEAQAARLGVLLVKGGQWLLLLLQLRLALARCLAFALAVFALGCSCSVGIPLLLAL